MTSEKTARKSPGDLTMVTKTRSLVLSGQPTAPFAHDEAAMAKAAREMLDRHDRAVVTDADIKASEADIRSYIRDLLLASGLARSEDIQLESQRTDLRTGQAIFEVKRRIGLVGTEPSAENLEQLDGYLDEAARTGRPERLGILADGRHWALRPSSETGREFNASQVRTFTLRTEHDAGDWLIWMRDRIGAHSAEPRDSEPCHRGPVFRHHRGRAQRDRRASGPLRRQRRQPDRRRPSAACGKTCSAPRWGKSSRRPTIPMGCSCATPISPRPPRWRFRRRSGSTLRGSPPPTPAA